MSNGSRTAVSSGRRLSNYIWDRGHMNHRMNHCARKCAVSSTFQSVQSFSDMLHANSFSFSVWFWEDVLWNPWEPFLCARHWCSFYYCLTILFFPFSYNISKVILSPYRAVVFGTSPLLTLYRLLEHLLISRLFRGLSQTTGGVSEKDWTKTFVSSYFTTINGNILLASCAERMGMWIGVFGGGRKKMLSGLNEGRFTQYNEGRTQGFTADAYLKRPGKYCFGTEGFICRYTYPLQPLAPTWGLELSPGSLLFFFFFNLKGWKFWDFSLTL